MSAFKIRYVNGTGIIAVGINWVTNSLWDHVEIDSGTGWIGAHAGTGIQNRPYDYCVPTRERRYSLACSQKQIDTILASAFKDVGTGYNYLDILGLMFKNRKLDTQGREICSQWVCSKAYEGAIYMLNCQPGYMQLITPETLHLSPLHMPEFYGECTYSKE